MSEDGAAHLIAVDGGRPVGVVSALDVVRALVGGPARA
jgi:CBS domain-containing protein